MSREAEHPHRALNTGLIARTLKGVAIRINTHLSVQKHIYTVHIYICTVQCNSCVQFISTSNKKSWESLNVQLRNVGCTERMIKRPLEPQTTEGAVTSGLSEALFLSASSFLLIELS